MLLTCQDFFYQYVDMKKSRRQPYPSGTESDMEGGSLTSGTESDEGGLGKIVRWGQKCPLHAELEQILVF